MASVSLKDIIAKMKLENLTPELDISKVKITQPDINRPALQMAGYFEHFEAIRLCGVYVYVGSAGSKEKGDLYQAAFL